MNSYTGMHVPNISLEIQCKTKNLQPVDETNYVNPCYFILEFMFVRFGQSLPDYNRCYCERLAIKINSNFPTICFRI